MQEHRFYHPEHELKYHKFEKGWTFVSTTAWKNARNSTIGGVGILLSPFALKSLNKIEKISPRISIATFHGNPCTTVIACYCPHNERPEEEVQEFYDTLSSIVREVPKHNVLIIGGDMNAQLGQNEQHRFTYHNSCNRNGEYLQQFLTEMHLKCLNTRFQKRDGKLWTHTYLNNTKAQLDFLMINQKWINSVKNCEAYNTFEGVSSDHRIVTMETNLSLRISKNKSSKSPPFEWSHLKDPDIKQKYTITLKNRFEALQEKEENPTNNTSYTHFVIAHKEAAEQNIPKKEKIKKKAPWENEEILEKRKIVKDLGKIKRKNPTRLNARRHQLAQKELELSYTNLQQKYIQEQIDEIRMTHVSKQSSQAWKIVKDISGKKRSCQAKLKADSQEERLDKWKSHFKNLLGNIPNVANTPIQKICDVNPKIKLGLFTRPELASAKKKIKFGKACGLDTIPPEVWKSDEFDTELLGFCNGVYEGNHIDAWTEGCILPFPKKGDLGLASNYRGITLTAIAAKIYNLLLLNRIQPELEKILRRNQNGFRKNRSTVGQILTVRRIIEGVKSKNLTATLLFVDFSKAFDSIHRGQMQKILLAYGIPDETVSAIMMLYKNTKSLVRSPDGDTDFFEILAGVLQGDTLAPFLFIICLDYVLRTSVDTNKQLGLTLQTANGRRHPAVNITDADYADDLALLSNTIKGAEQLLHHLEEAAANIGLSVNAKKTEFISYNEQGAIQSKNDIPLLKVDDFTYLGSNIASTEKDIQIRIGKAWGALTQMNTIWKSNLPDGLKRDFFRSVVESVLLYGSSTWTLTKKLEKTIDGTYTRMLRAVLNVSWKSHPTKARLYGPLPPVSHTIRLRRLTFAGHCWRSKDEIVSDLILWHPKHGRAPRGRPRKTYINQLLDDTQLQRDNIEAAMSDRETWRHLSDEVRAIRPQR